MGNMRPIHVIPLVLFVLVGIALFVGLGLNPKIIPTALKGKPVPEFDMPALYAGALGYSVADLKDGEAKLVNVFASWCLPCRAEHPALMRLQDMGVTIYGLNYKDDDTAAIRFLVELEDPYARIGTDRSGRIGIEWGVYGVPETFIISGDGQIIDKYVGPMDDKAVDEIVLPHLRALGWSAGE